MPRVLEVDDVHRVHRIGLVRLPIRSAARQHDALILRRRQQHARRLIAHVAGVQAGDRL
jgi:hypothetical protein